MQYPFTKNIKHESTAIKMQINQTINLVNKMVSYIII